MICVIARLSPDADEKLQAIRKAALPEQSFPALHGHITLASYLPEESSAFVQACRKMFRGIHSFSVRYEKIEVLSETSIIVAVPAESEILDSLHALMVKAFGSSMDFWTGGNNWRPHTTLLYDPEADLDAACRAMQQRFVPFDAWICQIELSKVEKTGYTVLETIVLS